jgi:hypothetical protein
MADDDNTPRELETAPHHQLEALLDASITKEHHISQLLSPDDSYLDGIDDEAAEFERREELRKMWDKSAPSLDEISTVNLDPVLLSDRDILARAACTPDDAVDVVAMPPYSVHVDAVVMDAVELTKRYRAQRKICRVWRRYSHIRVFAYFKQLICFKNHGHPVALLRCVCPQEAALVADPSSGLFVRFRLAGERFPPLIVYKLFTSVPVQDIGAFAPRDYTKVKAVPPAELHNYQASDCIPKTCVMMNPSDTMRTLTPATDTTGKGGTRVLKTTAGAVSLLTCCPSIQT